jgi:hypothetical protein
MPAALANAKVGSTATRGQAGQAAERQTPGQLGGQRRSRGAGQQAGALGERDHADAERPQRLDQSGQ